jgi:hypothetical protein
LGLRRSEAISWRREPQWPRIGPAACRGASRLRVPRKVGTWDPSLYSCPMVRPRRFASIPLGAGLASLNQQRPDTSTRTLGSRRQVRPHDQCILRTRRRRGLAGLRGVPLTARGVIPLGVDEERIGPGDAGRSQALRGTTHDRSSTTISPSARGSSNTATAFESNRRED